MAEHVDVVDMQAPLLLQRLRNAFDDAMTTTSCANVSVIHAVGGFAGEIVAHLYVQSGRHPDDLEGYLDAVQKVMHEVAHRLAEPGNEPTQGTG